MIDWLAFLEVLIAALLGSALVVSLYALGLPVLRRRRSTFICGIEDDARAVTGHLAGYLAAT